VSTDSKLRPAAGPTMGQAPASGTGHATLVANEQALLAEIERLQNEVSRLSRRLVEERADRTVQAQVQTVLSSLYCSPTVAPDDRLRPDPAGSSPDQPAGADPTGRRLSDGRVMPSALTVGGTVQRPEPGAPRVQEPAAPVGELYEFAPGDDSASAFDEFMNAPDPHLDKIRRFLLD